MVKLYYSAAAEESRSDLLPASIRLVWIRRAGNSVSSPTVREGGHQVSPLEFDLTPALPHGRANVVRVLYSHVARTTMNRGYNCVRYLDASKELAPQIYFMVYLVMKLAIFHNRPKKMRLLQEADILRRIAIH